MLSNFAVVLFFLLTAIIFVFVALLLGKLIRPNKPSDQKLSTYECGEPPIGSGWTNYNPRFYIIALIFLIFDVELAFVYPIATIFKEMTVAGYGGLVLVELLIFLTVLFLALVYVWAKGDLEWAKAFIRGGGKPVMGFEKALPDHERQK